MTEIRVYFDIGSLAEKSQILIDTRYPVNDMSPSGRGSGTVVEGIQCDVAYPRPARDKVMSLTG